MELDHESTTPDKEFNFNTPIEVIEIFRYRESEFGELKEFGSRLAFIWEEILLIKEYPFDDDWEKYPGNKYYVRLRSSGEQDMIILGDYDEMLFNWKAFRNKYPLFVDYGSGMDDR